MRLCADEEKGCDLFWCLGTCLTPDVAGWCGVCPEDPYSLFKRYYLSLSALPTVVCPLGGYSVAQTSSLPCPQAHQVSVYQAIISSITLPH